VGWLIIPKDASVWLACVETPVIPDTETIVAELVARINHVLVFLDIITIDQFLLAVERKIELPSLLCNSLTKVRYRF